MKIKIINPNTTWSMTREIEKAGKAAASNNTVVYAVSPSTGPASIESMYDEHLCIPGVLSEIIKGDREENADAFIIACFGDPGLEAAKEVTEKPVIGIAQAALCTAQMLAPNFSVVYALKRSDPIVEHVIHLHNMDGFCKSRRAPGLTVLDFDSNPENGMEALRRECFRCVNEDSAECIVLGCAGFAQFVERLNRELPVPVIDGVGAAVKYCEALFEMGLKPSKYNLWANPEPKEILGMPDVLKF